jgi:hypothetical protein
MRINCGLPYWLNDRGRTTRLVIGCSISRIRDGAASRCFIGVAMGDTRPGVPRRALPENTVPWELWKALRIMPARLAPTKHVLYVAFRDPADHGRLRAIEHMTGWSMSACVVSDQATNRLLSKVRPPDKDSTHTFECCGARRNGPNRGELRRETECHRGETHRMRALHLGAAARRSQGLRSCIPGQSQPLLNTLPLSVAHATAPVVH